MDKITEKIKELQVDADSTFITLVARNFGWEEQIPDPETDPTDNIMINNPESAEECVGRNIVMYIQQLAFNQQEADDNAEIADTLAQMKEEKLQARQILIKKLPVEKIGIN
jgi:pyrroloquinoline quinone (PQQ) biosynthesis protein C